VGGEHGSPIAVICADRVIAAPRHRIHRFLADLGCHWRLSDDAIELRRVETVPAGGRGLVRLNLPVPIHRTAVTEVQRATGTSLVAGTARIGTTTLADVAWHLEDTGHATRVSLRATIRRASRLDRLLLVLGGAHWLERRFRRALERLEERLSEQSREPRGVGEDRMLAARVRRRHHRERR
jgi:hypothetical protein